ncbi:hypothetical protein RMSM_06211 [Rhodopirellula maiorica SM1]|uniref:Uncharacterized protein n=1 Tax=Rhodopirellula maiorica SM1 TaxID=1265738 RepID=M5RBK8_9BACT|nr:hypothetical protein RMSM_06211 [Rhodopirellula maiorica SM1]
MKHFSDNENANSLQRKSQRHSATRVKPKLSASFATKKCYAAVAQTYRQLHCD